MSLLGGGEAITLKAVLVGTDESLSHSLESVAGLAGSVGETLAKVGLGVAGVLAGIGIASVHMATEFEDSLSRIVGLVGVSKSQVDAWGEQILALSKTLPTGPNELAQALYFVTSAGFRGARAFDVLTVSAKAAAAGLGTTMDVANAITSAMNAYGKGNLTASHAADVLTGTVREGKTAAEAIAPVLGMLLPLTSELGVNFNDVGAALASMTRTGNSAEEAATQLRAILTGLLKPSVAGAKALGKVGMSYAGIQKEIKQKGLFTALMDVNKAFHGNGTEIAKVIPRQRALRGFLALTGHNAKDNARIFRDLAHATGLTGKAFDEASQTAEFKFKTALSGLQAVGIQIGVQLLPLVKDVVDWFSKKAVPAIASFITEFKNGTGEGGKFRKELADVWTQLKSLWKVLVENKDSLKTVAAVIAGAVLGSLVNLATAVRGITAAFKVMRSVVYAMYNNVWGPVFSHMIGAVTTLLRLWAGMLRALSHVPGFGWAKTAANRLETAANKADGLARSIRNIPGSKTVSVNVVTRTVGGRIRLPNGQTYNAGLRAGGGPVVKGMSYLVGENGPELVTVGGSGHVTPARQTARALNGGGRAASGGGDDRPLLVQLMLDGRVIHEALLKRKRETGAPSMGLA